VAPLTLREAVGKTPRILIDSREQSPLRFKDIETERCLLPCGDYSIRGLTADVAIERKSLADLTHCCGKDRPRFIEQIERMRSYRFRALVVEARHTDVSIGAFRSNINPKSVVGTLIKIAHELDVPVWYAEDADGASELVQQMLTREHRKARDRK
jgi:ERCC4-type nuclease